MDKMEVEGLATEGQICSSFSEDKLRREMYATSMIIGDILEAILEA